MKEMRLLHTFLLHCRPLEFVYLRLIPCDWQVEMILSVSVFFTLKFVLCCCVW